MTVDLSKKKNNFVSCSLKEISKSSKS